MSTHVALLRGINVGGRNKVPMAELRQLCGELGWADVRTYIQSGNVVFEADGARSDLEDTLQTAIAERFGLTTPVIVRAAADWPAYVAGNPFPDVSVTAPNRVLLALSRAEPHPDAVAGLRERASGDERVAAVGDAIWIYFDAGVGTSKLVPGLFDRLVGSPVTTRNWRTVLRLDAMMRQNP